MKNPIKTKISVVFQRTLYTNIDNSTGTTQLTKDDVTIWQTFRFNALLTVDFYDGWVKTTQQDNDKLKHESLKNKIPIIKDNKGGIELGTKPTKGQSGSSKGKGKKKGKNLPKF